VGALIIHHLAAQKKCSFQIFAFKLCQTITSSVCQLGVFSFLFNFLGLKFWNVFLIFFAIFLKNLH